MIDKNDVKMPVRREGTEETSGEERTGQLVALLNLVNDVPSNRNLRLTENYYSRFHWFGDTGKRHDRSYYSYQENAVHNFIFQLNRSGILSDQVGMGKTIEAGMIVSELACRNELKSLLIIVPNEIMAEKWESELSEKFGIRKSTERIDGVEFRYPGVHAIKSYSDFCRCVFDCIAGIDFPVFREHKFSHNYTAKDGDTVASVLKKFISDDLKEAVDLINSSYTSSLQVLYDGKTFSLKGTDLKCAYRYDEKGQIAKYLNNNRHQDTPAQIERLVNRSAFNNTYETLLKAELSGLYNLIGEYVATDPIKLHMIATLMADSKHDPILVIPINYTEYDGETPTLIPFLNRELLSKDKMNDYRYRYSILDEEGSISHEAYDSYRIIDFFIEAGYQTLIVDEVHDYIDVAAKVNRRAFHEENGYKSYPSGEYDCFELFDDYYFIKKSSLYKKLKDLADKANRKIFLTATPIKSDMVDFYLLTLLASNKDSEAFRKIRDNFENLVPDRAKQEDAVQTLYNDLKECIENSVAEYFTIHGNECFRREYSDSDTQEENDGRYLYPYFNNSFLIANSKNKKLVRKYLFGRLSYMSLEEMFMSLVIAYKTEKESERSSDYDVPKILESLYDLLENDTDGFLQTRVVFRALLDNPLKQRFEEDFTKEDGTPIRRIRELLELSDGPRRWHKTYRKYGIRHTRHQTYNLSGCEDLKYISAENQKKYQNLPVWPRRNGKVIFLLRDDEFFDSYLVMRPYETEPPAPVQMSDLPNYKKLRSHEEEKTPKFEAAVRIFDYIDRAMSGGDEVYHRPQSLYYESVTLDDEGMLDYKLALVNKLMSTDKDHKDELLGSVSRRVLLFAEKGREQILEWFRYQDCKPLCEGWTPDPAKAEEYRRKRDRYKAGNLLGDWRVSESTQDLNESDGNVLIVIDPKRYEKGIDLQKADTIINFDINYDPLKMEQRIGRIDRIRPDRQSRDINIISFVPYNDMSGFVINFFANEMKMFTQWMGETTGIVSIPEEDRAKRKALGQGVSFESKVLELEEFYKMLYRLCKTQLPKAEIEKMALSFCTYFGGAYEATKTDFEFLNALRERFDTAFRNSISQRNSGYPVEGSDRRVMRFNSSRGIFSSCAAGDCAKCGENCSAGNRSNNYAAFKKAALSFATEGKKFYEQALADCTERGNETVIGRSDKGANGRSGAHKEMDSEHYFKERVESFSEKLGTAWKALFPKDNKDPFTMPFEDFSKLFGPMKELYWDAVVAKYLNVVLGQFYKQCDSVLESAKLFEKFIKTLAITEFMSDMEGRA